MSSLAKRKKNDGRRRRRDGPDADQRLSGGVPIISRKDRKRCVVKVDPSCQFFPDVYHCWAVTEVTDITCDAVTSRILTFKLNGPFNNFGPQYNCAGAFSANVPSGANCILGGDLPGGSNQPYNRSTVEEVDYQITINGNQGGTFGTIPVRVVVFASNQPSCLGMSISAAAEQATAVSTIIPPQLTSSPVTLCDKIKIANVVGVSPNEVSNNLGYAQIAGTDPANLCYLHVLLTSSDGTTNMHETLQFRFHTKFKFTNRNSLTTTVPTMQQMLARTGSQSSTIAVPSSINPTPRIIIPPDQLSDYARDYVMIKRG